MEESTGSGMKNSLILPSLTKRMNSFRDENYEPMYMYNDEFMRHFVRQSIKGGHCSALNQVYISTISDQVFNNISQELGVDGNICGILDKQFEYTNKHR